MLNIYSKYFVWYINQISWYFLFLTLYIFLRRHKEKRIQLSNSEMSSPPPFNMAGPGGLLPTNLNLPVSSQLGFSSLANSMSSEILQQSSSMTYGYGDGDPPSPILEDNSDIEVD